MERRWGQKGGPWEFNLRDMFRWCELMQADQSPGFYNPGQHVALVYADRMRTETDKLQVRSLAGRPAGRPLPARTTILCLFSTFSVCTGAVGVQKSIWGGL